VDNQKLVVIGMIVGVHGLEGNVKVRSYAESTALFGPDRELTARRGDGRETVYRIRWAKPHGGLLLLSLQGVDDRNAAEALKGTEVFIDRTRLPELEEGTYYWADLIGLDVYARDDAYLGRVASIIPTGGNDVYVVRQDGEDLLIPATEQVVLNVDLVRRTMRVELPEGL
jgi:16S rRNA processing protein RimM